MELLSEESKTVGGVHAAALTDARRVWDKIAATSAAGSARAERTRRSERCEWCWRRTMWRVR